MQALGEAGGADQAVACLDTMVREGLQPNVSKMSLSELTWYRINKTNTATGNFICCSYGCLSGTTIASTRTARKNEETKCIGKYCSLHHRDKCICTSWGRVYWYLLLVKSVRLFVFKCLFSFGLDVAYKMLIGMEKDGPEPNIYTYNTVTRAFAESGRLEEALQILSSIRLRGLSPDRFTFTTLLIACGRTDSSDEVHPDINILLPAAPFCLLFCCACLLFVCFYSCDFKRTDK